MARILVVEDCPDSRALVESSLVDHELRLADSVAAAERALGAARFELVLLDLGLPDGDGFQICQRLQQGAETRDLPVVFLTASLELRDKVLAFQLGADDYVVKPFHPAELRVRVEARLRRARREAASEVLALARALSRRARGRSAARSHPARAAPAAPSRPPARAGGVARTDPRVPVGRHRGVRPHHRHPRV